MSLRSRLLILAYLFAVALPLLGARLQATVYAATPPVCYVQSLVVVSGKTKTTTTKIDSCNPEKLPGGEVEGNEDKCFLASASNSGVSNFTVGSCATLEANAQGVGKYATNPAGDCGGDNGNGGCYCSGESGDCITDDIQKVVDALAIGVGVVITIVIMVAGLQYMTSRDNAQAVQAAKMRILNAVIALVAFIFIYAFLQWVIPGGLFSSTSTSVALPGRDLFISGGRR